MAGKISQLLIAIFAIILLLGALASINPSFIHRPAPIIVLPISLKVTYPYPIQDMDFHSLSRRDLRTFSKKNWIPANNMINVAMADALRAVQTDGGVGVIKETPPFQSPMKAEVGFPNLPPTSWSTLARREVVAEEKQLGNPLPRARRAAIKGYEIMKLISEGKEERKEEEAQEEKVCQGEEQKQLEHGPKETSKTPTVAWKTWRKASKGTEGHEDPLEVRITPATRYSWRASRGAPTPMAGEGKHE